ncbi:MAG: hypothetical protein HKN92_02815 [Chitinophagales bacterium]|nr:hypothetical protein [Chitinophagales bacterium]
MIKLLERGKIDDKKWNGCVHFGFNGLPYGYTWYLDVVGEQWKGLVFGDYEAVFPLVYNKKWGFSYLYQPLFTQQLGIFSLDPLPAKIIDQFYNTIPQEYRLIEIQVTPHNWKERSDFETTMRPNFLLDLNKPYEETRASYSSNLKRNLKQAEKASNRIVNQVKVEEFADFYRKHTAPKIAGYNKKTYFMMMRLIYNCQHYNIGFLNGVRNDKGELQAAGFFITNQKYIINLAPATSNNGRKNGAMAMLIDYIVRSNENQARTLDFEGSSIESIAKFYKNFGAEEKKFLQLRKNKLPWILKLLK